jgi:hypothetical protein
MKNNYELRITNYEWGKLHLSFLIFMFAVAIPLRAQEVPIVTMRPDRAAPGMNVVVELLTSYNDLNASRPFGYDALDSDVSVNFVHPADTARIMIGPPIVSWNGRLIQIPIFVFPNASVGPVAFSVISAVSARSDTVNFFIDSTEHLGPITHDTTIGNGFGNLSASNVLLVDSLIVTNATIHFSLTNPDTTPSNPRLLPVVILSKGPIRLTNSTISVDADSLDGGPGGGGGGHGFGGIGGGIGGAGFTGGGSCPSNSVGSAGSDSVGTAVAGGRAATGVIGGGSDPDDQGGGGGTGAPYGMSGLASLGSSPSASGEYGGGSGGGEAVNPFIEYGGGGGGFGTAGAGGAQPFGSGANGGDENGGRFLIPLAGGSGGGAGNSVDLGDGTFGGSGGGGGGAIELISYDSIVANSATFSARGDSGTTGANIAAGGGGGSGGAIYLASTKGIQAIATSILVNGGSFGRAADSDAYPGGAGGLGRVRIDGRSNLTSTRQLAGVWTEGVSLAPQQGGLPANGFVRVSGFAPDSINMLDTVRVFYRTRHTVWQWVDTLRGEDGSWTKWLPLTHDSALFVMALAEVNGPASDPADNDYEPNWLMSNVGMGIITHPSSPFLVAVDTLNFGTVRLNRCKKLDLVISNEGEAPLTLGKGALSGSADFSITPDTPFVIAPYTSDTLEVQFCPDSAGSESATVTFISNDSANAPKTVTLLGVGLKRNDSLVLSPASIRFPPVLIGNCASDTVTLISAGTDTLYLDRSNWNIPPFTLQLVPPDTALAPKQKEEMIVTFCPTDSGEISATQVLDGRQDSIVMEGVGVLRLATSLGTKNLGISCLGHAVTFTDTISNLGNDTVIIEGWRGRHPPRGDSLNAILQPHEDTTITISWTPDSAGVFADTIFYQLSDTTLETTIGYHVAGAELRFDSSIEFTPRCLGQSDTDSVHITNIGPDTLVVLQFELPGGSPFTLLDSAAQIVPGQRIFLHLAFAPSDTLVHSDTLRVTMSDAGCDSTIAIALVGRGIVTGLAAEFIDFGSVLVDTCREDSMLVANPCGPAAKIDSIRFTNPAFRLLDSIPISIPSDGSVEVAFRFCPQDTGIAIDTITIIPDSGAPFNAVLRGMGFTHPNPWAHFTLSRAAVPAGDKATTSITLDSSSLAGKHLVRGVVSFDPTVVSPEGGFLIRLQTAAMDSADFEDTIDFSNPGPIGSVNWLALLGPRASTQIGLAMTADTFVNIQVLPGEVTVTDCTGLNGQFSPGGSYSMGPVIPNPASGAASVALTLGNDGYVEAGLYDMAGKLIENIVAQSFARGSYAVNIPMSSLASGRYLVVVHSLGWEASRPLIINW